MRRVLETELLRTTTWPDVKQLASLTEVGHRAADRVCEGEFEEWNTLEHRFHQELYALSPLDVVQAEVERLWWLSNVYRMVNFDYADSNGRAYAIGYYQRMLDALEAHDRDGLVHHLEELRERTEHSYSEKLGRRLGA